MEMPTHPTSDSSHDTPKETAQQPSSSNSPPPAYTPPRPRSMNLAALAALEIQQSQAQQALQFVRPLWTSVLNGMPEDQDDGESISSISLRINTSVNVTKSNNIICLASSPADHANAIAQAVVQAIQKNSSGQCGIPMIDEDGRPRPVNIEVDASMVVEGSGNVIGGQDVISRVLGERFPQRLRRRREEEEEEEEEVEAESSQAPAKRRRSS